MHKDFAINWECCMIQTSWMKLTVFSFLWFWGMCWNLFSRVFLYNKKRKFFLLTVSMSFTQNTNELYIFAGVSLLGFVRQHFQ